VIARELPDLNQPAVESESDVDFTLDPIVLAERRAVSARRLHTVQVPVLRAAGFVILCAIALAPWMAQHVVEFARVAFGDGLLK